MKFQGKRKALPAIQCIKSPSSPHSHPPPLPSTVEQMRKAIYNRRRIAIKLAGYMATTIYQCVFTLVPAQSVDLKASNQFTIYIHDDIEQINCKLICSFK